MNGEAPHWRTIRLTVEDGRRIGLMAILSVVAAVVPLVPAALARARVGEAAPAALCAHAAARDASGVVRCDVAAAGSAPLSGGPALLAGVRLDVNRASKEELELLPEIGPGLAARIVADRAEHGAFQAVEDLDRVKGIGPARIERLRPFVSVR